MGKGWRTLVVHYYYTKVLGYSDDIGQLELPIFDADNNVRKNNGD